MKVNQQSNGISTGILVKSKGEGVGPQFGEDGGTVFSGADSPAAHGIELLVSFWPSAPGGFTNTECQAVQG